MTAEKKIAHQRLTLLQVAETDPKRFRGLPPPRDIPEPVLRVQAGLPGAGIGWIGGPAADTEEFPERNAPGVPGEGDCSFHQHPAWGPMKLSDQLRLENSVSPSTVRNIWIKEEMETRYKTAASHGGTEERPGYRSYGGADPSSREGQSLFP